MSSVYNILKFTTLESNMSPEQNLFDSNFPGAAYTRSRVCSFRSWFHYAYTGLKNECGEQHSTPAHHHATGEAPYHDNFDHHLPLCTTFRYP